MTYFDHKYLRQLRLEGGWSQEDLAERLGVDVRTYRRYETGQVNEGGGFDVRHVRRMNILTLLAQVLELPGPESLLVQGAPPETSPYPPSPGRKIDTTHLRPVSGPLVGRQRELEWLESCLKPGAPRLVSVVAWGGAGKTTLIQAFLARLGTRALAGEGESGPSRVFAWSFGEQEAGSGTADLFWNEALPFFGIPLEENGGQSPLPSWERARRLADHLQAEPGLLVLDGLEALQATGPIPGELRCVGMALLLRRLAAWNQGLCVVTTRLPVPGLSGWEGHTSQTWYLSGLSDGEGQRLLTSLGVTGSPHELEAASRAWKGQPLMLQLLGRWMVEGARRGQAWREGDLATFAGAGSDENNERDGVGRILHGLPPIDRDLLAILAVCDGGVSLDMVEALLERGPLPTSSTHFPGIEQVRSALRRLSTLRLVEVNGEGVDLHPVVRHTCRLHLMTSEQARETHRRLFLLYLERGPQQPRDLGEMGPSILAVRHGCRAGLWQETWSMVLERMDRGHSFLVERLGATGVALECLAQAYDPPFVRLRVDVPPWLAVSLLSRTGRLLSLMGRCREGMAALRQVAEYSSDFSIPDVALARLALAENLRWMGRPAEALVETEALTQLEGDDQVTTFTRACAWGVAATTSLGMGTTPEDCPALLRLHHSLDWLMTVPPHTLNEQTRALASMLLLRGMLCDELMLARHIPPRGVETWPWRKVWAQEAGLLPLVEALYQLLEGRLCLVEMAPEGPDLTRAAHLLLGEDGALARLRQVNFLLFVPLAALAVADLYHLRGTTTDAIRAQHLLKETLNLVEGQGCLHIEQRLHEALHHFMSP